LGQRFPFGKHGLVAARFVGHAGARRSNAARAPLPDGRVSAEW